MANVQIDVHESDFAVDGPDALAGMPSLSMANVQIYFDESDLAVDGVESMTAYTIMLSPSHGRCTNRHS